MVKLSFWQVYDFIRHPVESIKKSWEYDLAKLDKTVAENELEKVVGERNSLSQTIDGLNKEVKALDEQIESYKGLKKERNDYKEESEQRGNLVSQLKAEKIRLIKLGKEILDNVPKIAIDALRQDPRYNVKPYIFVDSKGVILGYTLALIKEINVEPDLIGESYLRIFEKGCGCEADLEKRQVINMIDVRNIRKFFGRKDIEPFDLSIRVGRKKHEFHIAIKNPVCYRDLAGIGKGILNNEKNKDKIAYIPVYVGKLGGIRDVFHKGHSLKDTLKSNKEDKQYLELVSEGKVQKVNAGLIVRHGWRGEMLDKYDKLGPMKAYEALKKDLEILDSKKKAEEELRKVKERKIAVKQRLKQMKLGIKKRIKFRDKIIKEYGKRKWGNKKELMNAWDNKEDFKDFIYQCRKIRRETLSLNDDEKK